MDAMHENEEREIEELLRAHQVRVTPAGVAVLRILKANTVPVTAEALYDCVKETEKRPNLSTVYRVLERLETKGLVRKCDQLSEGKALYELGRHEHHHYFQCCSCGKLQPIEDCPLENTLRDLAKSLHIEVTGHTLALSGYCEGCLKKKRQKSDAETKENE